MNRRLAALCALLGCWGPNTSQALAERVTELEGENKFLREAVSQYRAANQDMWSQMATLGEAHATRNTAVVGYLLTQAAETWGVLQARAQSGRIH